MEKADWPRVKELSDRGQALRRTAEGRRREMEAARGVYAVTDVRLDPFSPGLQPFIRLAGKGLLALRDRAVACLGSLEQADAPWKDYYSQRRSALQALASMSEQAAAAAASMDIREAAERALKQGDMRGLSKLAETLMTAVTPAKGAPAPPRPAAALTTEAPGRSADLVTSYSEGTAKEARRLGLGLRRL